MDVRLVGSEKTEDYTVTDGDKRLGVLYHQHECSVLGDCWVFDVQVKGTFARDVYYYATPETAKSWIAKEVRNEEAESVLYRQSAESCA